MASSLSEFTAQMPDQRMQGLVAVFVAQSWFLKNLKFIENDTLAYRYNRETALPGIDFRAVNGLYPVNQSVGLTAPEVETLAIFGGPVITDSQLASPAFRRRKVMSKLQNAGLTFDYMMFNGNPAVNVNQFLGLYSRVGGSQVISAGANGGAIVLDQAVQAQDQTVGTDNAQKPLLMCKAMRRILSSEVRDQARGMGVFDASGTQILKFNDSPVVVFDEYASPTPPLTMTESWGSSNATGSIWCVALGGEVDEENLQGIVKKQNAPQGPAPVGQGPDAVPGGFSPIGYKNVGDFGEYYKDLVEACMTPATFHPRCVTRYAGITSAEASPY